MKQKKPNMADGANASATLGKTNVISAANIQCVKLPNACPEARLRLGNISLIKTHITVPWPMECAAMNTKIQAGTIAKFPVWNAQAHKPREPMYPNDPIYSTDCIFIPQRQIIHARVLVVHLRPRLHVFKVSL